MLLKLKVDCIECKTKGGERFVAFKVTEKDGKRLDLKFRKECENVPTESCYIYVEKENLSKDTTKLYPVWWVKKIEKIEEREKAFRVTDYFEEA